MIRWLLILLPFQVFSQLAMTRGMGGADVAGKNLTGSNPANFTSSKCVSVSTPFLMKELGLIQGHLSVDHNGGGWLFSGSYQGDRYWNESLVSIARRQQIGRQTNLGLSIDWFGTNIQSEYPLSYSALSFGVGFWSMLQEKVAIGAVLQNPAQLSFSETEFQKPKTSFEIGFCYLSSERFNLSFEIEKALRRRSIYRIGIRIIPSKHTLLLCGWHSLPSVFSAGFGFQYRSWHLIVAGEHHPWIGFTPSISFVHAPKK